jgi:hypothetical protein
MVSKRSVSGSAAKGQGKSRAKTPKARRPIAAIVATTVIACGLLTAGGIYAFVNGWLPFLGDGGPSRPSPPKVAKAITPPSEHAKPSGLPAPASSGQAANAGLARNSGKPAIAIPRLGAPGAPPPRTAGAARSYNQEHLAKDVDEIKKLSKAIKTYDESRTVAEKGIVLAERAIVLGKADTAKEVAVVALAAARIANAYTLARRATVLLIQLQVPLSDAVKKAAKVRLSEADDIAAAVAEDIGPQGQPFPVDDDVSRDSSAGGHVAKWGKTEAERRSIFYDLLKAVDDYGMTPEGRKVWKDIQKRNGIDAGATLGILNEGFSALSDWNQPDGGGKASSRMNRMQWIGDRTRSMTEPMLKE